MLPRVHRTLHHLFKSYSYRKPQSGSRKQEGRREMREREKREREKRGKETGREGSREGRRGREERMGGGKPFMFPVRNTSPSYHAMHDSLM